MKKEKEKKSFENKSKSVEPKKTIKELTTSGNVSGNKSGNKSGN